MEPAELVRCSVCQQLAPAALVPDARADTYTCPTCSKSDSTPSERVNTDVDPDLGGTTIIRPASRISEIPQSDDDTGSIFTINPPGAPRTQPPVLIATPAPLPLPDLPRLPLTPPSTLDPDRPVRPKGSKRDSGSHATVKHFGAYEILGEISRGSFGVVYRAKQPGLDRVVALKVLLAGGHASEEAIARFQREARAVARLKHPNVVPIYDIGTHEDHHFFAMEFIDGSPLSAHITEKKLTISTALAMAEALADALESAHHAGVIHRDVKPSNILVDHEGIPHITDFGLAKQVDLDTKYTVSGTTLGTPAYMPPEQARGEIEKIDVRSDVYAIGAVMYEMLTGQTPFGGRSLLEVVVAVINEPVKPPCLLNPKIHRDVQTIVLKCLEKDPRLRYSSAAELRDDIRRFRSGEAIRAKPAGIFRNFGRYLKQYSLPLASCVVVAGAMFAVYRSVLQVEEEKKRNEELQKQIKDVVVSREAEWRPDWWFPPKTPADLKTEDQLRLYTIPTGREKSFAGLTVGTVDVPDLKGKVPAHETLVSPLDARFYGDVDAQLKIELDANAASAGFRVGLQSIDEGFGGIPIVCEFIPGNAVEFKPPTARIIGPTELYAFTSARKGEEKPKLKLEVKAEKEIAMLLPGTYSLTILREGTRITFSLVGPNRKPESIAIKDPNLSNWVFKTTQLVFRKTVTGLKVVSGEVKRKYGNEDERAFNFFREGEYYVAEQELRVLAEGEDPLMKARALYQLGMIKEICVHPGQVGGEELVLYTNALSELERMPKRTPEAQTLIAELRMRRLIRFAKNKQWNAVEKELATGWPNNARVVEPLVWELQGVIEKLLIEPDKERALQPTLAIFQHMDVTPGSARLGKSALELATFLSEQRAYSSMLDLNKAFPSRTLLTPFITAAGQAVRDDRMDEAANLLAVATQYARSVEERDKLAEAAKRLLTAYMRAHNYKAAVRLYTSTEHMPARLLTAMSDELEKQAQSLSVASIEQMMADLLPAVIDKMPTDARSLQVMDKSATALAKGMVKLGRVREVLKLHEMLRAAALQDARSTAPDPRMADAFADAITALATSGNHNSEDLALKLLGYCANYVDANNPRIAKAAGLLADRMVIIDDTRGYEVILKIQEAYPSLTLIGRVDAIIDELHQRRRYEDSLALYAQAWITFHQAARALTPRAITAFENVPPDLRSQLLNLTWNTVHDGFEHQREETAGRYWQLEFADVELALADFESARGIYQQLCSMQDVEADLTGRASLRLAVLHFIFPGAAQPGELLARAREVPGMPEDFTLALQYIGAPDTLRPEELAEKLKKIERPAVSEQEWALLRGLRHQIDGDTGAAQEQIRKAMGGATLSHPWVFSAASQLLRHPARSPEELVKPE